MLRQLRQAPVATESTCCDQLVALPGTLAGLSEKDHWSGFVEISINALKFAKVTKVTYVRRPPWLP